MEKTYNKLYLKELLRVLKDDIKDLGMWSAYNDDLINEEVEDITDLLDDIKRKALD